MPSFEEQLSQLYSKEKTLKQKAIRQEKVERRRKINQERGKLTEQHLTKNAPKEFHSANPVGLSKPNMLKKKRFDETKVLDPRHGIKTKMSTFDPRYGFLEDMLRNELEEFYSKYNSIDGDENAEEKKEWKRKIDRHETRLNAIVQSKLRKDIEKEYYQKQAELIEKTGQAPHILSKKRLDSLVKVRRFEQLKEAGKLDKYLTKKRKRNYEKDVKKMLPENKKQRRD